MEQRARHVACVHGTELGREREREVLELLALGHTQREIAERIGVGTKSVETYRARVADKLGLKTRAELVRYALRHGLLPQY